MNDRDHVGVYLMNGRANVAPHSLAYPMACGRPESGTPAT